MSSKRKKCELVWKQSGNKCNRDTLFIRKCAHLQEDATALPLVWCDNMGVCESKIWNQNSYLVHADKPQHWLTARCCCGGWPHTRSSRSHSPQDWGWSACGWSRSNRWSPTRHSSAKRCSAWWEVYGGKKQRSVRCALIPPSPVRRGGFGALAMWNVSVNLFNPLERRVWKSKKHLKKKNVWKNYK